jgi:O-antigen/teichoic acid export membrane protein
VNAILNQQPAASAPNQAVRQPAVDRSGWSPGATGLFASAEMHEAMGLYLPATVAFRLINFGRIILLTWFMLPQQFGLLTMILLAVNVLTPLCSLGLNEAVTRYVPHHESRGDLAQFIKRAFGLLLAVTAISVLLIQLFAERLGVFFYAQVFTDQGRFLQFKGDAPLLARFSGAVIGLLIVYFFLLAVFKGLRMFKALAVMEIVHGVIFLALSVAAIVTRQLSALTLTGLYGISLFVPIVFFGIAFFGHLGRIPHDAAGTAAQRWARRLLRFSVWTTLAGITWQALLYYPTWFLNKVHGHEAVAIFSAARQIGQFVMIGAVAVVTVVLTTVTRTWETEGREAAHRQLSLAFRGTAMGLLLLCAALALLRDVIIRVFQPGYASSADVLPLHLLFFLFAAHLAFLPIHFYLHEKTRHMFWPWAVGVAANAFFAYWLAGPARETTRSLPPWQKLGPVLDAIFVTGFSGPMGMDAAAWCGVLAIFAALLFCVLLIRAECTRLDRGTYLVVLAAFLLALKPAWLVTALAALLLVALRTRWIFTPHERNRIRQFVFDALGQIPPIRALSRWRRHDR